MAIVLTCMLDPESPNPQAKPSKLQTDANQVKYDDGGNRNGVPLAQLRPLEQAERDGTGLSYTSTFNESWWHVEVVL